MKIIEEWVRERMRSAQEMPPGQLINTYRDSLKTKENPLSEIYEKEILRRLWAVEQVCKRPSGLDRFFNIPEF